ncbi:hypothetical protein WICPIJ_009797 [Wickerhamomyces pijperi]|uniref:Uncharacterized protein n=1 Tax=Wickerhamomyces pijperi TaxID=599730 RepID=A0A9P8PLF3_WICPI|nr:hypothetical protein WICPIJ_009797 [Wickerhamomyces pijperi]
MFGLELEQQFEQWNLGIDRNCLVAIEVLELLIPEVLAVEGALLEDCCWVGTGAFCSWGLYLLWRALRWLLVRTVTVVRLRAVWSRVTVVGVGSSSWSRSVVRSSSTAGGVSGSGRRLSWSWCGLGGRGSWSSCLLHVVVLWSLVWLGGGALLDDLLDVSDEQRVQQIHDTFLLGHSQGSFKRNPNTLQVHGPNLNDISHLFGL